MNKRKTLIVLTHSFFLAVILVCILLKRMDAAQTAGLIGIMTIIVLKELPNE